MKADSQVMKVNKRRYTKGPWRYGCDWGEHGAVADCGECSEACPQKIPLHLLNRKVISDSNKLYGEYQAGADAGARSPLTDFRKTDAEPSAGPNRGV